MTPDIMSTGQLTGTFREHILDELQRVTRLLLLVPHDQSKYLGIVKNKEGGNLTTHQSSYSDSLVVFKSKLHYFTGLRSWSRGSTCMYECICVYVCTNFAQRTDLYHAPPHKPASTEYKTGSQIVLGKESNHMAVKKTTGTLPFPPLISLFYFPYLQQKNIYRP